jgi:WbqC-like protein family
MKKIAIMQPTYLPWLGYFDLIKTVDTFVIYDHVQFEKQSWQQRNRIRTKDGELMLTLAVKHGAGLERAIKDVEIDYSRNITKKHLTTLTLNYAKAVNYKKLIDELHDIYSADHQKLIELNMALIRWGMTQLKIEKEIVFSSTLDIKGQKVEALIDVCQKLDATHYHSPIGSKGYIDENNLFEKFGIELSYQHYTPPHYQQLNYKDHISHLSFVDFLFNATNIEI